MSCRWGGLLASLLCISTVTTRCLGQSGYDGDWGSGFDVSMTTLGAIFNSSSSQQFIDVPGGSQRGSLVKTPFPASQALPSPTPVFHDKPEVDECAVRYSTGQASARRLKAQIQDLSYLKDIQHGNQAVVENLVQYVGAELQDEQRYEDVITENIAGIREEHQSCDRVVQEVVRDLDAELGGDILEALAGIQRIKEESLVFKELLQAAEVIAARLDTSSQTLHASFTKQLKESLKSLHH